MDPRLSVCLPMVRQGIAKVRLPSGLLLTLSLHIVGERGPVSLACWQSPSGSEDAEFVVSPHQLLNTGPFFLPFHFFISPSRCAAAAPWRRSARFCLRAGLHMRVWVTNGQRRHRYPLVVALDCFCFRGASNLRCPQSWLPVLPCAERVKQRKKLQSCCAATPAIEGGMEAKKVKQRHIMIAARQEPEDTDAHFSFFLSLLLRH